MIRDKKQKKEKECDPWIFIFNAILRIFVTFPGNITTSVSSLIIGLGGVIFIFVLKKFLVRKVKSWLLTVRVSFTPQGVQTTRANPISSILGHKNTTNQYFCCRGGFFLMTAKLRINVENTKFIQNLFSSRSQVQNHHLHHWKFVSRLHNNY